MEEKPQRSVSRLNYRRPDHERLKPIDIKVPQKPQEVVFDDLVQANSETRRDRLEKRRQQIEKWLKSSVFPKIQRFKGKMIARAKKVDYKKYSWQQVTAVTVLVVVSITVINVTGETDRFILGAYDEQNHQLQQQTDDEIGVLASESNIDGVDVVVSRQDLPQKYRDNPSELEELAKSIGSVSSVQSISTSRGLAYIAEKVGNEQIAVLAFNEKLIFITSDLYIRPDIWIDYINTLN